MNTLLQVILTPSCWIQNYPYSAEWDRELNKLMDESSFRNFDGLEAEIGVQTVWIANHPYASFTAEKGYGPRTMRVRPSRRTIFKANQKLWSDWNSTQ